MGVASQPCHGICEYFNYGPPEGSEGNYQVNSIRAAYSLIGASLLAVLAACSSGGSVDIGRGQGIDPGTVDFPVAYVKHFFDAQTLPDYDQLNNPGRTRLAVPDADVFMRTSASPSGTEIDVTGAITSDGPYDIKDLDASPDGTKLIFSMRGPLANNMDERDPPYWTLWEFDTTAPVSDTNPHQVIDPALFPTSGNDVSPHYLPDGSIVFSSTRQRGSRAALLDEGKPGYEAQFQNAGESAFLLHVLSADRQSIEQITYNIGHDLWPETLRDEDPLPDNPQSSRFVPRQGRIMFSRWDNSGGGMSLYTANADGTGLQLLYGARSHRLIEGGNDVYGQDFQFTHARPMEDGRVLALARPFDQDTDQGGDLLILDTEDYVESTQMLANAAPTGPAQSRVTPNQVTIVDGPSPGGRFLSAYPLWDGSGRILVSWSLCRLQDSTAAAPVPLACTDANLADPNYIPAAPLYSAFMFSPIDNTFKPLFTPAEGVMISDLVALQARAPLWARSQDLLNPLLAGQGVGLLSIRSVYDFDGQQAHTVTGTGTATCPATNRTIAMLADPTLCTADDRPARFIRIEEAVSRFDRQLDMSLPDVDFGAAIGSGVGFMRVILGYAPIEPDGSVSVRVPANVPFTFDILDKDGRRLPQFGRHTSWLQLRPGEERHCNGCHEAPAGANAVEQSHGRDGTTISAWAGTDAGLPFPNTLASTGGTTQSGDTMALARARTSCAGGSTTCSELPGVNLRETDAWTNPTPQLVVNLSYGGGGFGIGEGLSTLAPTSSGCQLAWKSNCRIVINYEANINPLWSTPRQVTASDGMGGTVVVADHTCINCHAPTDAMGAPQVPAGQLDLSDGPRDATTQHKNSYTELVTGGNQQQLDANGQLQFVTIMVDSGQVDAMGNPILVPQQVPEPARLAPLSARGSTRFFDRFANGGGTVDHRGFLTPGELRLISEWVDIGAQYYNNPFDPGVPLNN